MLRIILAAVVAGVGLGITVATITGNLSIEGVAMGLTSIGLMSAFSGIAFLYSRKHKISTDHS